MSEIRAPATRTMARALAEADLRPVLDSIAARTLLVCGENDERSPREVTEALGRLIPASTIEVLPGLGHECFLEDINTFETVVRAFLHGPTSALTGNLRGSRPPLA